jgi:hypothetical protein
MTPRNDATPPQAPLAVAALSQWPGLRTVSRLDLARGVRERSG